MIHKILPNVTIITEDGKINDSKIDFTENNGLEISLTAKKDFDLLKYLLSSGLNFFCSSFRTFSNAHIACRIQWYLGKKGLHSKNLLPQFLHFYLRLRNFILTRFPKAGISLISRSW